MAETYDAVIVGGGHNGLTCGAYLARAGLKTPVLERRPVIGGAAVSEEIVRGFIFSVFSYVMSLLHPKAIRELELKAHGFAVLPASDLFCPLPDGNHVVLSDSVERTQASFARFSRRDAEVFPAFNRYLGETTNVVRRLLLETPIDPSGRGWRHFRRNAEFLWRYRTVGDRFYRTVDLMTMSADAYLSRWFESEVVKAVLAYYSGIGTFAGPRTPGSAYVIMHHLMGEHAGAGGWGFIPGGMGTISKAIARSGETHGMAVRTDAEVASIDVAGGRVTGVTTGDGATIRASVVASNASCKVTFLKLVPEAALPADFVRDVRNYRTFSTAFKVNIACERLPAYRAFEAATCGFPYPSYTHIGPTIDYLKKAFQDAREGWWSKDPFVTPVTPTVVDTTIVPPGKHVVHLFGGHAPYALRNATWENERDRFAADVLKKMDEYAPGFTSGIVGMQVLAPKPAASCMRIAPLIALPSASSKVAASILPAARAT